VSSVCEHEFNQITLMRPLVLHINTGNLSKVAEQVVDDLIRSRSEIN